MRSPLPLALLLTIFDATNAIRIPFDIFTSSTSTSSLLRRDSDLPVNNIGNAQYVGNITVGGVQARVLLDTGSSDLWINFPDQQPSSTDLGKAITLAYAVGSAEGYDGLLGLGPNEGSVIYKKLSGDTGDNTLTNIFQQNSGDPPYITILLDRTNAPAENFTGQLTISETVEGFSSVTSMPLLDVETVNKLLSSDQHWQAITDKDVGIIGPDGNPIQVDSIVPSAPDGTYVAVFDSGFTFSQVPRDVSDAIYGRVQGAVFDSTNQYWTVPCGQYLNISIGFGGVNYPVHPLDTVDDNFGITDSAGNRVCIGAFQPITSAFSLLGHYDMILGMSFLRNAYMLLGYGDWVNGNSSDHPYVQLLPITNSAQAKQDFINTRLGGTDSTNATQWALLPANETQHSPLTADEKKEQYEELILSRWPYILVGCLVAVLLALGCCIWRCCCSAKAKARRARRKAKKSKLFSTEPASTAYLPLEAPHKSGGAPGGQHAYSQSQYSLNSQYSQQAQPYGAASDYYDTQQPPQYQSYAR
ncbi:hypothetical protein H0H92_004313 [Tricholoma furcatifolium]|nr:hypothetical protein H0H92_004313 [Tricholoma furcatifolium]